MIDTESLALGPDLAFRMARQRVHLTGHGATSTKRVGGITHREVVLPGCILLVSNAGNAGSAQLFYPDHRPMSTYIDVQNPEMFASLIHNIDCSILREMPDFPTTGFEIADRAAFAEHRQRVEDLDDRLQLSDAKTKRDLRMSAREMLEETIEDRYCLSWVHNPAMRDHLATIAFLDASIPPSMVKFMAGESLPPLADDPEWSSLVRCNLRMDDRIMVAAGAERKSWSIDGYEWRQMETVAGVTACARSVERLEGDVLQKGEQFFALFQDERIVVVAVIDRDGNEEIYQSKHFQRTTSHQETAAMVEFLKENAMPAAAPSP